jgi:hypothetical protein
MYAPNRQLLALWTPGPKKGGERRGYRPSILASTLPVLTHHDAQDTQPKRPECAVAAGEEYTQKVHTSVRQLEVQDTPLAVRTPRSVAADRIRTLKWNNF